jgi:hypothetical protein
MGFLTLFLGLDRVYLYFITERTASFSRIELPSPSLSVPRAIVHNDNRGDTPHTMAPQASRKQHPVKRGWNPSREMCRLRGDGLYSFSHVLYAASRSALWQSSDCDHALGMVCYRIASSQSD